MPSIIIMLIIFLSPLWLFEKPLSPVHNGTIWPNFQKSAELFLLLAYMLLGLTYERTLIEHCVTVDVFMLPKTIAPVFSHKVFN